MRMSLFVCSPKSFYGFVSIRFPLGRASFLVEVPDRVFTKKQDLAILLVRTGFPLSILPQSFDQRSPVGLVNHNRIDSVAIQCLLPATLEFDDLQVCEPCVPGNQVGMGIHK